MNNEVAEYADTLKNVSPDLTDEQIAAECARVFIPGPASKPWTVVAKSVLSLPFLFVGIVVGFIVHAFIAGYIFGESALNKLAEDTQRK